MNHIARLNFAVFAMDKAASLADIAKASAPTLAGGARVTGGYGAIGGLLGLLQSRAGHRGTDTMRGATIGAGAGAGGSLGMVGGGMLGRMLTSLATRDPELRAFGQLAGAPIGGIAGAIEGGGKTQDILNR